MGRRAPDDFTNGISYEVRIHSCAHDISLILAHGSLGPTTQGFVPDPSVGFVSPIVSVSLGGGGLHLGAFCADGVVPGSEAVLPRAQRAGATHGGGGEAGCGGTLFQDSTVPKLHDLRSVSAAPCNSSEYTATHIIPLMARACEPRNDADSRRAIVYSWSCLLADQLSLACAIFSVCLACSN